MQIQPVTSHTNFNGKLIFEPGTTTKLTKYTPDPLWRKFKEVSALVSKKPYNVYISKNKQDADFYNIAANKNLKSAQNIKEYTVKVKSNTMVDSVVDAAREAMDMYEKYIAKNIKG